MSVDNEVARILAEEGVAGVGQPLDPSKCTLMSFDHWDPEDIFGPNPAMVVAELDEHEALQLLARVDDEGQAA